MSIILGQKDDKFKDSLGYIMIMRQRQKQKQTKEKERRKCLVLSATAKHLETGIERLDAYTKLSCQPSTLISFNFY